jgi:hypothetical protein
MTFFFAYGDRMNPDRMTEFAPDAKVVGPARLPGYRLLFNVRSRTWGGGAANAVLDPASSMWGVLWDLGEADPTNLETSRGEDEPPQPLDVRVEGPDGTVAAQTMAIFSGERFVRPSERYVAMLRTQAEQQGLPQEALDAIDEAAEGMYGPAPTI